VSDVSPSDKKTLEVYDAAAEGGQGERTATSQRVGRAQCIFKITIENDPLEITGLPQKSMGVRKH
jgi:hypothetical protein